ncbi:Sec-dependent nitrous-oxide reductase, partial [bacterium]|nr:Sec-dependent nitrous-oxide reductase [bacterium]
PSMRIIKYVAVFTPEPWQGYGFDDESKEVLAQGRSDGKDIVYGDTHHPAFSETDGEYDGQFIFINDKANPRIAVIDLHDFETKQIVVNPFFRSSHGGAFVTPNNEYIMEASQYAAPYKDDFVPLEDFNDEYRGGVTYWKFNREAGRIDPENSFTFEMPPYSQDLCDAGKGPSFGWGFTNSFCSERYVGGIERGRPPFEAGCSSKDTDFMHVTNWKKAEALVAAGKVEKVNGSYLISMEQAIEEEILFLIPEPKSPHGCDITPDGKHIIVSGKLDSHAWVYSFEKIMAAIDSKNFEGYDPYGLPIIGLDTALERSVNVGLGPLHTQFDSVDGVCYTSIYVDSQITKWNYKTGKVLSTIPIHYNVGHLMTMEGDSKTPDGKYLVALNKLSIDRFNPVGPLHPQNHQLIDISGEQMQLLYDMPLPLGEPHYAVAIKADKLKPTNRYKVGWDSRTDQKSPYRVRAGREKVERDGNRVHVYGTLIRSHITPEIIEVTVGDEVSIHLTNLERAEDEVHGFAMYGQNVQLSIEPGKTASTTFTADKAGVYPYYCTEFCSALHLEMQGYLLVQPKGYVAETKEMEIGTAYSKEDYESQVATNLATQDIINSVVAIITSYNYKDFPTVVDLVTDAFDQLGFVEEVKAKSEAAAAEGDYQNAMLWANQWWQYQVKTADLGLRAKTYLEQNGAVKVN